ncbi:sugar transferase [Polynucleobacter paneuropaeus]|nr:sugar transferase [Polynucleobacter paneuropaeus]
MFRLHLKRSIDLALSVIAGTILIIPGIMVAILIKLTSPGPILYWSTRIGKGNQLFKMPKFRSMRIDAPEIPSHLMANHAQNFLTPIGPFLRKSSLDELPQLWSIFKGDMSFVGPRPPLFNQDDLIFGRKGFGIDVLKPGLTGWAQVNGRDEIGLEQKLQYDAEYLQRQSFRFDIYILWLTLLRVVRRDGISH